jgi:hypothetical protein
MSESLLFLGLLFGCIGFGYFLYGKNQRAPVPFVCGVVLMIFPYFVSNAIVLVIVGAVLMAVPYFIRL